MFKKRKKEAPVEGKAGKFRIGGIVAGLLVAVSLFLVMLYTEKKALEQEETKTIFCSVAEIPAGTVLTAESVVELFEQREIPLGILPQQYVDTTENLIGKQIPDTIPEGVYLYPSMFQTMQAAVGEIYKPVLVAFAADELAQVVGGGLRVGDRIGLYGADAETGEIKPLWENLYIAECYDNSGNKIAPGEDGCAQLFSVYVSRGEVERFLTDLSSNTLFAVKQTSD